MSTPTPPVATDPRVEAASEALVASKLAVFTACHHEDGLDCAEAEAVTKKIDRALALLDALDGGQAEDGCDAVLIRCEYVDVVTQERCTRPQSHAGRHSVVFPFAPPAPRQPEPVARAYEYDCGHTEFVGLRHNPKPCDKCPFEDGGLLVRSYDLVPTPGGDS